MPIYEYECERCGRFEVIQSSSDKPLKCKPECGDKSCPKKAKRVISAAAFHLVGSGWYKTDYASPAKKKSDAEASKADSSSSSSSDSKKETSGSATKSHSCGSGCGCS